jgi:Ca2+-binding EF-hand superfamily protein
MADANRIISNDQTRISPGTVPSNVTGPVGVESLRSLYHSLDRDGDNSVHLEDIVHYISEKYDAPPELVDKAAEKWLASVSSNGYIDYAHFQRYAF